MAHPDPHRAGAERAERDERPHAGQAGQAGDSGQQRNLSSRSDAPAAKRQEQAPDRAAAPSDASGRHRSPGSGNDSGDDAHFAPESGEKPEAMEGH